MAQGLEGGAGEEGQGSEKGGEQARRAGGTKQGKEEGNQWKGTKKGKTSDGKGRNQKGINQAEKELSKEQVAWWEKKKFILKMIQKLVKEHEKFKMYKADHQYSQFTQEGVKYNQKVAELRKSIQSLLKNWPRRVHNQKVCEMPKHPSCIQVGNGTRNSPTRRSSSHQIVIWSENFGYSGGAIVRKQT